MPELLPIGVVAGNNDRHGKPAHTEYAARAGMDVDPVQPMRRDDPACSEVKPERYADLFAETDRPEVDPDVARQVIDGRGEKQQVLTEQLTIQGVGKPADAADQRKEIIGDDPYSDNSPRRSSLPGDSSFFTRY